MPQTFTIFLLFTCYFLDRWNWVSLGQDFYPKASLQVSPGNVTVRGGDLTFICTGPYLGVRFVLYKDRNTLLHQDPPGQEAEFLITDVKQEAEGTYTCRYHTPSGPVTYSDASDPIQIRVIERDLPTTTRRNQLISTGKNQPTSPGKNQPTSPGSFPASAIYGVCAALLVIVLISAAVLYCKWKRKKASGDIQKSALPLSEEVLPAAAEPTYASIAGKEADTIIVPDIEHQNKGEDEGLTYATINKEALKKKKTAAPSSYEPEATVYAAVNVR